MNTGPSNPPLGRWMSSCKESPPDEGQGVRVGRVIKSHMFAPKLPFISFVTPPRKSTTAGRVCGCCSPVQVTLFNAGDPHRQPSSCYFDSCMQQLSPHLDVSPAAALRGRLLAGECSALITPQPVSHSWTDRETMCGNKCSRRPRPGERGGTDRHLGILSGSSLPSVYLVVPVLRQDLLQEG